MALALLAILSPTGASADQFSPAPASPFAAGSQPVALATGDANGDGQIDMVAANQDTGTLTELVGYGNGQFAALNGVPVGNKPTSLAAGDFNGDGLSDVAVTDANDDDIRIMLASPSGYLSLAAGSPISVGATPVSVAAADLTGAGTPDLVVANLASGNVSVLIGNGSGGFNEAPGSPQAVNSPIALTIADFNRDGVPDMAVVDQVDNAVTVLLGTGTGDFQPGPTGPISVGSSPIAVKAADFNGDGAPDLAVLNRSDGTVSVLLGSGDGSFAAAPGSPTFVGGALSDMAVGDFDVDGRPDVVVADQQGNAISVLYGNGDGSLNAGSQTSVPVGPGPDALAVGDFDGGSPDLAVGNFDDGTVSVLLNNALGGAPCDACDPPILGRTVNLAPLKGHVRVKLPRRQHGRLIPGTRFIPLRTLRQLPVGTVVDTTKGEVRLSTAGARRGQMVQTAQLNGAVFQVLQRRHDRGLADLDLTASVSRRLCGPIRRTTATTSRLSAKTIALLHARAHGHFRTRTGESAATVRGTQWDTVQRCDGTLTRVRRGVVVVRDFRLRRNVVVRTGHSYLARR